MEENKKEIILGLDVSTACIGCCLLLNDGSKNGKIIELTHVVPKVSKKIKTIEALFLKNKIFTDEFLIKWKDFGITKVVIEEPLVSSNNSLTVSTLLRFNGMISNSVYEVLGIVPEYISSYDARKYAFPTLLSARKYAKDGKEHPKDKIIKDLKKDKVVLFGNLPWDLDKKAILQANVAENFPDIEWLYDKKGELKKENFDATDAYVACLGYLNQNRHEEIKPKVSNIEEYENAITYDLTYWGITEHRCIKINEIEE